MSDTATPQQMIEDDEMPLAPPTEGSTDTPPEGGLEFSSKMNFDLIKDAQSLGEPLPVGTYHFKLDKYEKRGKPNDDGQGPDPYYALSWKCQDPRFSGRMYWENVTWVRDVDFQAAMAGDAAARSKCLKRLVNMKDLQAACGFKGVGDYDVEKDFLDTMPEVKIQLKLVEKKDKDPRTGAWTVSTGQMKNDRVKYYPVMRQA
jgi:hypothetical protein